MRVRQTLSHEQLKLCILHTKHTIPFLFQDLAAAIAQHVREVRRIIGDDHLQAADIWCFDELRIYASP